jgi:hypothetical protein
MDINRPPINPADSLQGEVSNRAAAYIRRRVWRNSRLPAGGETGVAGNGCTHGE